MSFTELETLELFGNQLIDFAGTGELLLRFGLNFLVVYIIVKLIFYPLYQNQRYLFSYFLVNISVFLVCILLNSIKLKIGFAFGLFAVFAILRYRTEQIPIKEMTYLFVVIIVAVINAVSSKKVSYAEVLACNAIMVGSIFLVERSWLRVRIGVKKVRYEKIDLITPENRDELIKDLRERTGLDVSRVDIDRINFLNDTAWLNVFYKEAKRKET